MTTTTNDARIEALADVVENLNDSDQDFAHSMMDQFANRGELSEKQWVWIDRLAKRGEPRCSWADEPNPAARLVDPDGSAGGGEFLPLADLFAGAAKSSANPKGLVHPKMRFDLAGIDPSWRGDLLLKRAGGFAQYPGSINVTNGMPYDDPHGLFYGRVHKDGRFERGRDFTSRVKGILQAINCNPVSMAADYGRKTGNCCFCATPLSDDRSTSVGYGPICADRYGLPWGLPLTTKGTP